MYVCLCRGVTNKDIRKAVEEGIHDFEDLQEELGVALQCGACHQLAEIELELSLRGWKTSTHHEVDLGEKT